MKKILTALPLLALLLLSACEEETYYSINGVVAEVLSSKNGAEIVLVLAGGGLGGRKLGVLVDEETQPSWPGESEVWTREENLARFLEELQVGCHVHIAGPSVPQKVTSNSGEELSAARAEYVSIQGQLYKEAVTMADGTSLDVVEEDNVRTYQLSDGTQLLWVHAPVSPATVCPQEQEYFHKLDRQVQEQIIAFYEDRGLLYEETAELEKAYAGYRKSGRVGSVCQSVALTCSSTQMLYMETSLTAFLPEEGEYRNWEWLWSDPFDRETGEHIPLQDVFVCPLKEVLAFLMDIDQVEDSALRRQMEETLTPERVVISKEGLSIRFERGSLPGMGEERDSLVLSASLEDVSGLFQPWALPQR